MSEYLPLKYRAKILTVTGVSLDSSVCKRLRTVILTYSICA